MNVCSFSFFIYKFTYWHLISVFVFQLLIFAISWLHFFSPVVCITTFSEYLLTFLCPHPLHPSSWSYSGTSQAIFHTTAFHYSKLHQRYLHSIRIALLIQLDDRQWYQHYHPSYLLFCIINNYYQFQFIPINLYHFYSIFVFSQNRSFYYNHLCSLVYLFIFSFIYSFIHLFIYFFIFLIIHSFFHFWMISFSFFHRQQKLGRLQYGTYVRTISARVQIFSIALMAVDSFASSKQTKGLRSCTGMKSNHIEKYKLYRDQ